MTFDELLEGIDLTGFPAELRLSVKKGDIRPDTLRREEFLVIELKTRSREYNDHPWLVAHEPKIPDWVYASLIAADDEPAAALDMAALDWVFTMVEHVITHELAEQFLYKGKRFFDPHPNTEL